MPLLHFHRAPHRIDDAAEFDEDPISCALDDAAVMDGDGWIDQVTAERAQPRQSAIFIGAGEPVKPTTSAAKIAASFRFSGMTYPRRKTSIAQLPCSEMTVHPKPRPLPRAISLMGLFEP
jgi:hypothetical protein